MASKVSAPVVFLLSLNLLFSTLVSSQSPSPLPQPSPPPPPPPPRTPILTPPPTPPPSPPPPATCIRPLNVAVCADLLGLLSLGVTIPPNPASRCCRALIGVGNTNVQIGTCLCASLKANVLGIIIVDLDVATTVILNSCYRPLPSGFRCP